MGILVHVSGTNANTLYDKYPVNGQNLAGLQNNKDEWASLSEQDMHDLWHSGTNTVMKIVYPGGGGTKQGIPGPPRTFYIQRTNSTAEFSPFRAIRYVPEWG